MIREGLVAEGMTQSSPARTIVKAATKGVIKVMSKMGISAVQSYHGAQVFEAVGLRQDVHRSILHRGPPRASAASAWTSLRRKCCCAIAPRSRARQLNGDALTTGGLYQWRADGESHLFNPRVHPPPAEGGAHRQLTRLQVVRAADRRSVEEPVHAARAAGVQARRCRADRGSRVGREHRQALQDRRDVLWLDQQGGARDAGHRDEPHRRQEQHR